jgi:hypothetical protein
LLGCHRVKMSESNLSDLLAKALEKLRNAGGGIEDVKKTAQSSSKNWLRNASLSRAEMHIRNHAEGLDLFRWENVSVDSLDDSGLDADEKRVISDWFSNKISGMHCACLLQAKWASEETEKSSRLSSSQTLCAGSASISVLDRDKSTVTPARTLLDMMGSMIAFPVTALEMDDNFLYKNLFSKPPLAVIGEILKILTEKAIETAPTTMLAEQINLAFKQFRVEKMRTVPVDLPKNEDDEENQGVSIDTELEKLGFICNKNTLLDDDDDDDDDDDLEELEIDSDYESELGLESNTNKDIDENLKDSNESDVGYQNGQNQQRYFQILMELVAQYVTSSGNFMNSQSTSSGEDYGSNGNMSPTNADSDASSWMVEVNAMQIECELDTPLDQVLAEAESLTHVELNEMNVPLKNYITHLSGLKSTLDKTLKEMEESESYMALGVSKNSSDSEIKKAYHKLAVKTHPDKPGGDTAKFQVLQKAYQEIKRRRGIEAAAREELVNSQKSEEESVTSTCEGSGKKKAEQLVMDMHSAVTVAKSAAEQIAALAQMAIHLAKTSTAITETNKFPEAVEMLRQVVFDSNGDCRLDLLRSALEPTETMSDALQSLASSSVSLTGCGHRYASCAAKMTEYTKVTEAAMQGGLTLMRCITSLMQVERHVNECVDKLNESIWQTAEDPGIHDIIAQMVETVVKCCSSTMSSVAERALGAALAAADVARVAQLVVDAADEEALQEATRKAEMKERMTDFENDPNGGNGMSGDGKVDGDENQGNDKDKESNKVGEEEEEEDGLAGLQKRVKKLQVQIRVQNISILQTLNAEARHLQSKVHDRLNSLATSEIASSELKMPVMTLLADLVDHSCETLRTNCADGVINSLQDWSDLLAERLGWMREPRSGRLALLPDLRSRAMWMAVLADDTAMTELVGTEVRRRLRACLKSCPSECKWAVRQAKSKKKDGSIFKHIVVQDDAKSTVETFISDVLTGIKSLTITKDPLEETEPTTMPSPTPVSTFSAE